MRGVWQTLKKSAQANFRRVNNDSDYLTSSKKKRVDTVTSRRVSTSSNTSNHKESKNQKTLEQRPSSHLNNPSLCKIKKRLAKKSGRSDHEYDSSSKNLIKMLNDNNLTVKVKRKGSKKSKKKIMKTGIPSSKHNRHGAGSKMFHGRKTVTTIFREQRSHPLVRSEKYKRSGLAGSNPKGRKMGVKKNQTLYSFKKSRKKTASSSKDRIGGKGQTKFAFLDQQRLRNISTSKFIKSFSNQKLMTMKDRKQSHSIRMQSLRRQGGHPEAISKHLKNSKSVKELKRNFSLRNSSQTRMKHKSKLKTKAKGSQQKGKRSRLKPKSLTKKNMEFLCEGCEVKKYPKFQTRKKSQSKPKKARRETISLKPSVSLRKNFSNFQFHQRDPHSKRKSSKGYKQRMLQTEKADNNYTSSLRPTWVSGTKVSKQLNTETMQTYYTPSIPSQQMGMHKKMSAGGILPYSKRMLKKTAYYNSLHLNGSPEMLLPSKPANDCQRENGSFLTNSILKKSSLLGIPKNKMISNERRFIKASPKGKRQNVGRVIFRNQQSIKSKPILKELVKQLKGNDSLQLEILKTLGCQIKVQKSPKRGSKKMKSKSKLKSKSNLKTRTKSTSKAFDSKRFSRPKKSKLEKLRNLNRLISKDKLQVSKIKNELEKSSLKGSKMPAKSSKSKSKRTRQKLMIQPSLIPPSILMRPKPNAPSTEHEKKSIGFVSEPFSLQNHQIFQYKQSKDKALKYNALIAKQGLDLTSLRLGSKAFSKKKQTNTLYIVSNNKKKKMKENLPTKLRTAKKSRRQNFQLNSNMLSRVGSTSSLKPKGMGSGHGRKSPGKKRVMCDEDIRHHMNIIFTNDLNLERRKPKKRKRMFN